MRIRPCPSEAILQAFHRGELPEAFLEELAEHLKSCPKCKARNAGQDRMLKPIADAFPLTNPVAVTDEYPPIPREEPLQQAGAEGTNLKGPELPPQELPPQELPPQELPPQELPPQELLPGKPSLRGYELLEPLGRGGMGIVFKARQVALNRVVAVKMTSWGFLSPSEDRARFRNEAEAAAQLQHPNLVQIHEIGEQDGELYLALEYVGGGTLEAWLANQPQPPRRAAELLETLARAIHYAHERNIIHRDLKPSNILLVADVQGDKPCQPLVPKIADFGLAKQMGRDLQLTQTGAVAGTPYYMAPEQAVGKKALFGPTMDIYSLGVILYQMLTGYVPFKGGGFHRTAAPPREPRSGTATAAAPDIPRDLQTICQKCLEKEPCKRYPTARDLADDLRRFLDGEPIKARPTPWWEHLWRRARKRPAIVTLVTAVLVTAAAGALGILGQWHNAIGERLRADQERQQALVARDAAETNLYFSRISQARLEWRPNNNIDGVRALLDACRPRPGERDRRGWEWSYLNSLLHADLQTLRSQSPGSVTAVAYSPDGRVLASAVGDYYSGGRGGSRVPNAIILWDAVTGEQQAVLPGHTRLIDGLAFSPDGRRLATVGRDDTIRIWDVAGRQLLQVLNSPASFPRTLAFSPDGQLLACGDESRNLNLWDVNTGEQTACLRGA